MDLTITRHKPKQQKIHRTFYLPEPVDAAIMAIATTDGHGTASQTIRDAIDTYIHLRSEHDGVDYIAAVSAHLAAAGAR